ncbi:MAG: hypothetical protein EBY52_04625, partial [Actinobacteria bacterium]|nr:hypothetical protein [Actinomycetota bacterium]
MLTIGGGELTEDLIVDAEEGASTGGEMPAPLDAHRLTAGGPVKGFGDRSPPVDDDRILVAIPHPETPDVEPLAGSGRVDPAEDQRAVTKVELGQAVDRTFDDRLAFVAVLLGATPLRVVPLRDPSRASSRLIETGVGPVEMSLFGIEFGVTFRHGNSFKGASNTTGMPSRSDRPGSGRQRRIGSLRSWSRSAWSSVLVAQRATPSTAASSLRSPST